MNPIALTQKEAKVMVFLAVLGFLIPNGIFCYYFLTDSAITKSALSNPVSIVFIAEAFLLMFLFAWLLKKAGAKAPSPVIFIIMSLVGSMAFSIPATLYLLLKEKTKK